MKKPLFMNNRFGIFALIVCILIIGCGGDDETGPAKVANLVVNTEVKTDGSGKVRVTVSADNAKFFKYSFGDVPNEVPVQETLTSVSHTYEKSGTYTVTVQAHSTEADFISKSSEITVSVFIPIPTSGYTTPTTYTGMNKIWSDEFEGTAVDASKWTFEIGDGCPNCGWGNNELQYYKSENAKLYEGNLLIEAKAETAGGKNYTSARMITKGKFDFKYGRVDVRAALPEGQGLWPAIWMLGSNISTVGWPKCGEIDIMEMIGGSGRENTVHGTAHWWESEMVPHASYGGSKSLSGEIYKDKFHVFTVTWDQEYIRWYVDDVKFHEILTTPAGLTEFQASHFLILNVAVGGNWPGSPDAATQFPQRMIVDYIRVFQNQ
jgi:beta-glucanase (GH16 family)